MKTPTLHFNLGDDGTRTVARPDSLRPSSIRPSGCGLGKKIACTAGGLAAAMMACGGGTFAISPTCIGAVDQLAGLGCCDCLPKGPIRDLCRDL